MSHYCRDVQLFQNKFGFAVPSDFIFIPPELFDFRVKFFYEEFNEYKDAVEANDLGTAVDSLIDLVYITCGTAIYHGIGYDRFETILNIDHKNLFPLKENQTGVPHFLSYDQHVEFCTHVDRCITEYSDAYAIKNEKRIKVALGSLYLNCLFASTAMDLTNEQWDEMWADVQRANMSKERAVSATQSKRGSTYDIFKPEGWVGPRTEELIQKYISQGT